MKAFFSALSRNAGTLLLSLAIVLALGYYLLVYVPERTTSLNARYFRVLTRIGGNIKDKVDAQHLNDEGDARSIAHLMSYQLPAFWKYFPKGSQLPADRGPAGFVEATNQLLADRTGPEKYRLQPARDTGMYKHSLRLVGNQFEFGFIVPPSPVEGQLGWRNGLVQTLTHPQKGKLPAAEAVLPTGADTYELTHTMPVDSLIRELRRPDVFDYFFVVALPSQRLLYANGDGDFYLASTDDGKASPGRPPRWLADSSQAHTGRAGAFTFSGQQYQLFAQPVRLGPHLTCLLVGGVQGHRFDAERRALPAGWFELLLGGLLLGVLALPFMKLRLMSPREQIHRRDVLLCAASLVLGSGVLLLTLKAARAKYETDALITQHLHDLAENVAGGLHQELGQLNTIARQVDQSLRNMHRPEAHGALLDMPRGVSATYFQRRKADDSSDDYITWITKEGQAQYGLDGDAGIDSTCVAAGTTVVSAAAKDSVDALSKAMRLSYCLPSLASRRYLQKLKAGQYQLVRDDSCRVGVPTTDTCYFDMLRTVRPVSPLRQPNSLAAPAIPYLKAIVARPSTLDANLLCVFETRLVCFDDRVIPPGYGFCLLEPNGEVMAHSDPALNLSENLLTDCEPRGELEATLYANAQQPGRAIEVTYQGQPVLLYVRPLAGMGRYLITFFDLNYAKAQQSQTALLALTLLLGFWLLAAAVALLYWLVLRVVRQRSQHDQFQRLWPRPAYAHRYWQVALAQGLALLALAGVAGQVGPLSQLGLLVVVPLPLFVLTYHHTRLQTTSKRGVIAWVIGLAVAPVAVVLVANWYLVGARETYWLIGLALVLGLLVAGLLRAEQWPRLLQPNWSYRITYVWLLLGWVVVLGIVPALSCYRVAELAERLQQVRAGQLAILKLSGQQSARHRSLDELYYHASFFFKSKFKPFVARDTAYQIRPAEQAALQFFADVRMPTSQTGAEAANALSLDATRNAQWHPWQVSSLADDTLTVITQDNASRSWVSSQVPGLQMGWPRPLPHSLSAGASWLLVGGMWALITALLWMLISYLLRRLFGLSDAAVVSPDLPAAIAPPAGLVRRFWVLPAGSAWADVPAWAAEKLAGPAGAPPVVWGWPLPHDWSKAGLAVQVLDYRQYAALPDSEWQKMLAALPHPAKQAAPPLPIVLASFDYRPAEVGLTQRRVELLAALQEHGWPLVVLSASHPDVFGDCGHPLEKPCPDAGHRPLRDAGQRLLDALAEFQFEYFALQSTKPVDVPADVETDLFGPEQLTMEEPELGYIDEDAQSPRPLRKFFNDECRAFPFVAGLREVLLAKLWQQQQAGHPITHGTIETAVQRLAQFHFRRLWLALSPQEKFLLFDLAQDGLVNTDNAHALGILLQKGFLRRAENGRLSLRSASFCGFIRTAQRQREALQYVADSEQGAWAATQTPLLLLLAAGAVFMFVTQPTTFSQTQTFLLGLTTLLPALAGLFRFLLTPKAPSGGAAGN